MDRSEFRRSLVLATAIGIVVCGTLRADDPFGDDISPAFPEPILPLADDATPLRGQDVEAGGLVIPFIVFDEGGFYFATVDAIRFDVKKPGTTIGHPDAPQALNRFGAASGAAFAGAGVGAATLDPSLIGERQDDPEHFGARVVWGWETSDYERFEFEGLWVGEETASFQRGLGGLNAGANQDTVRVTAALPLSDGNNGYAVPYDQFFRIALDTKVHGIGAMYTPPVGWWWGSIRIQPAIGVHYFDIDELFSFDGADSGLAYEHLETGVPDTATFDPMNSFPAYTAFVRSKASTQLIGPLFAIRLRTSGKRIRIVGDYGVGLMVNDETVSINGNGIGQGFSGGFIQNSPFSASASDTRLSPVFRSNVNVEVDVARFLPLISHLPMIEHAKLRLGYYAFVAGQISRPTDTIVWQGQPLFPVLQEGRSTWRMRGWSAGLIWEI